jgi:hypothetical protein
MILCFNYAYAVQGTVVLYKSDCDFFIVKTPKGYALLELYNGFEPAEGDTITGNIETFGYQDVFNTTQKEELHVWVEDYYLSKEKVVEKYVQNCRD